jgi:hypothetical protein
MVLEMELCMLLLETLDTRMLGPPKMQENKEKRALQTLCKRGLEKKKKKNVKKKRMVFMQWFLCKVKALFWQGHSQNKQPLAFGLMGHIF